MRKTGRDEQESQKKRVPFYGTLLLAGSCQLIAGSDEAPEYHMVTGTAEFWSDRLISSAVAS